MRVGIRACDLQMLFCGPSEGKNGGVNEEEGEIFELQNPRSELRAEILMILERIR